MRLEFLLFGLSCLFSVCVCVDMIVGDTVHRKMVFHQRVKDFAIPFRKRIKSLSYTDPDKRQIKGIAVIDNDFSHASANITDGGVGYSYVTGLSQLQPPQVTNQAMMQAFLSDLRGFLTAVTPVKVKLN